jgi:hypothetical protein
MHVEFFRVQNLELLINPMQSSSALGETKIPTRFFPDPDEPPTPPATRVAPSKVYGVDSLEGVVPPVVMEACPVKGGIGAIMGVTPERTLGKDEATPATPGAKDATEFSKASKSSNVKVDMVRRRVIEQGWGNDRCNWSVREKLSQKGEVASRRKSRLHGSRHHEANKDQCWVKQTAKSTEETFWTCRHGAAAIAHMLWCRPCESDPRVCRGLGSD